MVEFLRRYPFLLALIVIAIAPFPMKEGLKQDAAVYTALAVQILETGDAWPLRLSPHLFQTYYEHPPGAIWAMVPFLKLPGPVEFTAALFSRLCTLATFLLGLWIVPRLSSSSEKRDVDTSRLIFVVLLLSWGQFLKYSATAQLEGPSALLVTAWIALFVSDRAQSRWALAHHLTIALVVGASAMLVKGLLFVPLFVAAIAWSLRRRSVNEALKTLALGSGFALAAGALLLLDQKHGTGFHDYYWGRLFRWGAGSDSGLLERLWGFLHGELRYAPLWSLGLWIVLAFRLSKRRSDLWQDLSTPSGLAVLAYFLFMAPIVAAEIKMPHWPVPIYPIAAAWLASRLPIALHERVTRFFSKPRRLELAVLVLAVGLAVLPYPKQSSHGRGEHYLYHRDELLQRTAPLIVVLDHLSEYSEKAYAAWALGFRYPLRFVSLSEIADSSCVLPSRLWIHPGLAAEQGGGLEHMGWRLAARQHERIRLFECRGPRELGR